PGLPDQDVAHRARRPQLPALSLQGRPAVGAARPRLRDAPSRERRRRGVASLLVRRAGLRAAPALFGLIGTTRSPTVVRECHTVGSDARAAGHRAPKAPNFNGLLMHPMLVLHLPH